MDDTEVDLELPGVQLPGILDVPADPIGIVIFAHGSGSSRLSPRNREVAARLAEDHLATLLFDLLTPEEGRDRRLVFDVRLLGDRLLQATSWVQERPELHGMPVGYFGASTGAAAALAAAANLGDAVAAVVSRGGRPDLAGGHLDRVTAPTLLIVGERDPTVLELNEDAQRQLAAPTELEVVAGATHLFEEPGTLEQVAALASAWFAKHLAR